MDWGWLLPPAVRFLDEVLAWISVAILASFDAMISAITRSLLITPNVTNLPQVQALTDRSIWIVDTVFVLAFVAAGILVMVAGGDERARYTVKDLLPRLIVGFIAAHFSQPLCRQAITLANSLVEGVSAPQTSDEAAFTAVHTHVHAATGSGLPGLLLVVITLLITVLVAATFFSLIVRFAALLVLTAAAPLALACHALPHTDPIARLWWRGYAGCLAIPVLQSMTLQAGQWMLTDPRHMLPVIGPSGGGALTNLFVVMVLLWYTVKIPALVGGFASQRGRSSSMVGTVVRVILIQGVARAVPGLRSMGR